ncbi:uncharacterized protein LOC127709434 [Mytilus californianus]|uniref:uncharacterized protein LOC127709434 n=1 Tax=Mytilus californianus TaxID=6549 RepID=UPI00224582CB|nr:uncharacterized protein LOC127709434 [Mytilus californianus]
MYNVNFMTGWMSHSSLIDSSLPMGSEFYFDFEMHMGGCGGFMTSYYLSNITVALGLPFELLKNSKEHEEELRDMNMTNTGSVRYTTYSGKISKDTANTGMIIGLTVGLVLLICGVMTVVIMVKFCKRLTTGSADTATIVNNQDHDHNQNHEHSNQEMNNINQGFQNVASIPNSPVVASNGNVDDDHYASIHEMNLANSSSNNDQLKSTCFVSK